MNERIKALAIEAGGGPSKWYNDPAVLEKFAELLVKECLTFVEPMPGSGDIDDLALEAAREGIKEHFGIKE